MKSVARTISLTAIAALVFACGCETVRDTFLGAFRDAAIEGIQTATTQAVEQTIQGVVQEAFQQQPGMPALPDAFGQFQQTIEQTVNQAASQIQEAVQQLPDSPITPS